MKKYTNMSGLEFSIIERVGKDKVLVKFTETGSVVETWRGNCKAGKVADPFHKSRLGIGYLGFFQKTSYHKPAYQLWSNMLKRCYDKNDKKGYYGRCVVAPEWHCYATFLDSLPKLEGFSDWKERKNMNLDKDILGDGTVYSHLTCKFVTEFENKSLGKKNKQFVNGEWVTTIL
jgi:hypothetical protein